MHVRVFVCERVSSCVDVKFRIFIEVTGRCQVYEFSFHTLCSSRQCLSFSLSFFLSLALLSSFFICYLESHSMYNVYVI